MHTVPIGRSDLHSTPLIYGCMRIAGTWNPAEVDAERRREAFAALDAAVDAGYNHFDHADIYCRTMCETLFGEYLRSHAGLRERILITTKCGIRFGGDPDPSAPHRYDFSAQWIEHSVNGSLRRLGVDTLDVLLLHRPDVLMNPTEVADVFGRLHEAGKVRYFGVSNFTPTQTALLQSRLDRPLVCNQIEVHPLRLSPFEDGTLDTLYMAGITPTSWSPLARGVLGADVASDDESTQRVHAALDAEGAALGVARDIVATAWLLAHPSCILPIIGSRRPERVRAAVAAADVTLSREAWYRIYLAARGKPLP